MGWDLKRCNYMRENKHHKRNFEMPRIENKIQIWKWSMIWWVISNLCKRDWQSTSDEDRHAPVAVDGDWAVFWHWYTLKPFRDSCMKGSERLPPLHFSENKITLLWLVQQSLWATKRSKICVVPPCNHSTDKQNNVNRSLGDMWPVSRQKLCPGKNNP